MTDEWPEITPLEGEVVPPPFPTDALPLWLSQFVHEQSRSSQVPEDMTGMLTFAALSAAAQGRITSVAAFGSWLEPITLYVAVVMPPGERKSSIFDQVTRPLVDWEAEVQALELPLVVKSQVERLELEKGVENTAHKVAKQASAVRDLEQNEIAGSDTVAAAKGDLDTARKQAEEARIMLSAHQTLYETRVLYNDLTPEACIQALSRNRHGAIAIMSDEGGVFDVLSGGRYSDRLNLDVFLKGHSGNRITVDRIGRDSETVQRPILTLGLAVQPAVLADIGKSKQMHGRGLLARFAYSIPETLIGRRVRSPGVSEGTRLAYAEGMKNIARAMYALDAIRFLPVAEDADERLATFQHEELEARLTPDEGDLDPIGDWANKETGLILRLATLLACARTQGVPEQVELADIEAALQFAPYFEVHAKKAFGLMGIIPSYSLEGKIVKRILREKVQTFKTRDVVHWSRAARSFDSKELEELLEGLAKMGYLKRVTESATKPIRTHWAVNPAIYVPEGG